MKTIGYTIYYPHLYTLFLKMFPIFLIKKKNRVQFSETTIRMS